MSCGGEPIPATAAEAVPWLSVEQMRDVDRMMVGELGITLERMMENAGRSLASLARRLVGGDVEGRSFVLMVGPGGNGGGGLVAARHLAVAGADVVVALAAAPERLAPVTAEQLAIVRRLAIPVNDRGVSGLGDPGLVIDALLGYGQRGDPYGEPAALIRWSGGRRVLALDVPSGLELASGLLRTPHVMAEATMTLALPKTGLADPGSADAVGRVFLADISVPALVYEKLNLQYRTPFGSASVVELGARPFPA